jgi:hypothetical protein
VLAAATVDGFYGLCTRGAKEWKLRCVVPSDTATEVITSKLGGGPVRRAGVDPGHAATFHHVPGVARVREPSDRISGHPATTVAATAPLDVQISHGTEPQFLRADVHLAFATVGGETGACALVASRVNART